MPVENICTTLPSDDCYECHKKIPSLKIVQIIFGITIDFCSSECWGKAMKRIGNQ